MRDIVVRRMDVNCCIRFGFFANWQLWRQIWLKVFVVLICSKRYLPLAIVLVLLCLDRPLLSFVSQLPVLSFCLLPAVWFDLDCFCAPVLCCNFTIAVIGTAMGLNLLFGLPLLAGVLLTAADVLLLLCAEVRIYRHTNTHSINFVFRQVCVRIVHILSSYSSSFSLFIVFWVSASWSQTA